MNRTLQSFIVGMFISIIPLNSRAVQPLGQIENDLFAAPKNYPVPLRSSSIVLADIDNDGDQDLIVSDTAACVQTAPGPITGTGIAVFKNDGTGSFGAGTIYDIDPAFVIAADANSDGYKDIVAADCIWGIWTLLNDGTGAFNELCEGVGVLRPSSISAGLLDEDSTEDLAITEPFIGLQEVQIVMKDHSDNCYAAVVATYEMEFPRRIDIFDFDNDTDQDFAVASGQGPIILENSGNATFQVRDTLAPGGVFPYSGDLDGDGDKDLAVIDGVGIYIWRYASSGFFVLDSAYQETPSSRPELHIADLDEDGSLDLLILNPDSSTISFLKNNGNGTFQNKIDYYVDGNSASAMSDIDGDGDPDLVIANGDSGFISIYRNLSDARNCAGQRGDLNYDNNFTPSDVVLMLSCVFLEGGNCDLCFADVSCNGILTASDVVIELNAVFLGEPICSN